MNSNFIKLFLLINVVDYRGIVFRSSATFYRVQYTVVCMLVISKFHNTHLKP